MTDTVRQDVSDYFSTSEEQAFVNCRLAHHFRYMLGYGPKVTNAKLSLGTIFHIGFEYIYKEYTMEDVLAKVDEAIAERKAEISKAYPKGVPGDVVMEFQKNSELVRHMVKDYRDWAQETGVDDGYVTVSVEEPLTVQFPGAPVPFKGKLDLLQRSERTGRLRVVDAKTRSSFTQDTTSYILSEQNGNYQLAVMAVYGERPTELAYREARKMNPVTNPRSKPPYFREIPIRLLKEEMKQRAKDFAQVCTIAKDPDHDIYANPGSKAVGRRAMGCMCPKFAETRGGSRGRSPARRGLAGAGNAGRPVPDGATVRRGIAAADAPSWPATASPRARDRR